MAALGVVVTLTATFVVTFTMLVLNRRGLNLRA